MTWQVWRGQSNGWMLALTTKRRWWARFYAWEHTKRGWFKYVVTREGEHPWA